MQEQNDNVLQDFQKDVIDESFKQPVVVDFWAEWCGPCKVLGPVLEKLAAKSDGAWKLVKIDTDVNPELAQMFGIRSIPLVKIFKDGNEADEFVGALPEQKIVEWLNKHITIIKTSDFDVAIKLLSEGDENGAISLLEQMLDGEQHKRARVLLAKLCLFTDMQRAETLIEGLDPEKEDWEIAEALKTITVLFGQLKDDSVFPDATVRSTFLLACSAIQSQDFNSALDLFIDTIREDRYYMDDYARKLCIAIFKYLGEEHPVTINHRRDFGRALYV